MWLFKLTNLMLFHLKLSWKIKEVIHEYTHLVKYLLSFWCVIFGFVTQIQQSKLNWTGTCATKLSKALSAAFSTFMKILVWESFTVTSKPVTFCWTKRWTPRSQISEWHACLTSIKLKAIPVESSGLSKCTLHPIYKAYTIYHLNLFSSWILHRFSYWNLWTHSCNLILIFIFTADMWLQSMHFWGILSQIRCLHFGVLLLEIVTGQRISNFHESGEGDDLLTYVSAEMITLRSFWLAMISIFFLYVHSIHYTKI